MNPRSVFGRPPGRPSGQGEDAGAATRWLVPLLSAIWLASTAWMRPLMLPDEGRYVGVAWEMLRSGEWLTPTLDGLPYFHKPPLFYWITAASLDLFGAHPLAARAAPLLGAWVGAMALYRFLGRWSTPTVARDALWVLLAMPLWAIGAQFANLDMLVAGCITLTVTLMAHTLLSAEQGTPDLRARDAAWAAAAVGVLAKGLIGVVLPVLVVAVWLLLRRRPLAARALVSARGLLLFVLIAAPWFVVMQLRFGDFLHYFFVVQHLQRYAGAGFNNAQPPWFYPVVVGLLSLPFLPGLRRLAGPAFRADPPRAALRWLLLAWCLVVLGFFSLPRSKLIGYALPAVPPLAALVAEAWSIARSGGSSRPWTRRAGVLVSATASVAVVVGLALQGARTSRELAAALVQHRAPGEPITLLRAYAFDLPFLARLEEPLRVVDDWDSPEVQTMDNWRKELADAGRFATVEARGALLQPSAAPTVACGSPVSWWVGSPAVAATWPFLSAARPMAANPDLTLWRLERDTPAVQAQLRCPGMPPDDGVAAP